MSKELKIDPHLFETSKKKQKPPSQKTRRNKRDTLSEILAASSGNEVTDIETITNTPPLKSILKKTKSLEPEKEKHTTSFGKKNGTVRIFIKDKDAYTKIESDKKKLAKHNMTQVRNYLRTRRLYTVGSSAPDDVLRTIYEDAHLTGNIENTNSTTLMQNFLNEDQNLP
jgi:hypothetical protein